MICENCQQRQAHVHVTQSLNGQTVEKHLCETCATEVKGQSSPFSFSVHEFLKDFYDEKYHSHDGHVRGMPGKKCNGCGQTYDDYKKTGLFGCPDCYRNFRFVIMPLAKRIQGQLQHTGKIPLKRERVHRFQKKKEHLQSVLREAVRNEAFEEAAEMRDQIQLLDRKINQLKGES